MKKIIPLFLFITSALTCSAQFHYELPHSQRQQTTKTTLAKKKSASAFDISKLTIGGGIGLQFGDYTLVNVAPQVGYNFSKYLNAGAGISYTYWKNDYYYNGDKYKESSNYFGFNIYGRFYPVQYVVLMVQPEINRVWQTVENKNTHQKYTEEKFVPVVLVGGGVRLGSMTAMIQYDVVQDDRTPYGNNIFYSVGYTFGF